MAGSFSEELAIPPAVEATKLEAPIENVRQALQHATHHLELARGQEAELEAWTLYAAELLQIPPGSQAQATSTATTTTSTDATDKTNNLLLPGLHDALDTLADVTISGMANSTTNHKDIAMGGQWATAVHRTSLAASIQSMAQQALTIATSRLLEGGPALKKAMDTIQHTANNQETASMNLWLQLFDEQWQSLKEYHARHDYNHQQQLQPLSKRPRLANPAADGYDLAAAVMEHLQPLQSESLFSVAEVLGKYLDLQGIYQTHGGQEWFRASTASSPTGAVPPPAASSTGQFQYTDFLHVLSRGLPMAWPEATKLVMRKHYVRFLHDLHTYMRGFMHRTAPLLDVASLEQQACREVDETWSRTGGFPPAWQEIPSQAVWAASSGVREEIDTTSAAITMPTIDLSLYATPGDLEAAVDGDALKGELARLGLKCGGTVSDRAKRLFLLKDTPLADLSQKHLAPQKKNGSGTERRIELVRLEASVVTLLNQVRPTLEATLRRSERQMGQTFAEREQELLEELYGSHAGPNEQKKKKDDNDDSDSDAPIYNPKNVPLDWDGKPIPYWLFKLHGLNHYYACEICAGEIYRGRRNFELHFADQKHAAGMKSLGIPNTKHFHGVTTIEDVQELWATLNAKVEQDQFDRTREEEYEDSHGNVLSRKTYEDLARQGLL
jgi:hypothetical protein